MTHEYTLLLGGLVLPGGTAPAATAIAWAADTILAIGTDDEVRSISRGDSRFVELAGARVVAAGEDPLEVGGPADLLVLAADPLDRAGDAHPPRHAIAVVRGGHVVDGALPAGSGPSLDHAP